MELRIADAKDLAEKIGARGVIILAFGPVTFASASSGKTKRECRSIGKLLDRICEKLASGEWCPWDEV